MRILLTTILLASVNALVAQPIYTTDASEISFFSSTPVEDIEAINTTSTSLLNVAKNEIVFRVPIAGFQFEKPLMQEHFNENYMETEKFPYATFKGKLSDTLDLTKDTVYRISATGMMNIHGVDKAETYTGVVEAKDGQAVLKSEFKVALKDHNIKVPKVVFANIAEEIDVKVFFQYKPYEKK
jgi:polyisoprenoid-binding protein YceI